MDYDGLWEGKNNFAFYASPFRFQFTDFEVTSATGFKAMMINYKQAINNIGNFAQTQPLVVNLVLWMSYIHYYYVEDPSNTSYAIIGADNLQYVEFSGEPSIVFKTSYQQAVASGYKGICNSSALSTTYSQANALFRVSLKHATLDSLIQQSDACAIALNRNMFSTSWGNLDTDYNIELDVRSFTTALAVNMGILDLTILGKSHVQSSYITFENQMYEVNEYFDARVHLMEPILCVTDVVWTNARHNATNITMNDLCFTRYGDTIFLPILNHIGSSLSKPVECTCEGKSKTASTCNQLNLILSMLYYPFNDETLFSSYDDDSVGYSTISTQLLKLIKLRAVYADYTALTRASYNASASSILAYLGHVPVTTEMDSSWFGDAFDFCMYYNQTTGATEHCAMFSFATINKQSKRITPYHYDLKQGHCKNSFSVLNDKEW